MYTCRQHKGTVARVGGGSAQSGGWGARRRGVCSTAARVPPPTHQVKMRPRLTAAALTSGSAFQARQRLRGDRGSWRESSSRPPPPPPLLLPGCVPSRMGCDSRASSAAGPNPWAASASFMAPSQGAQAPAGRRFAQSNLGAGGMGGESALAVAPAVYHTPSKVGQGRSGGQLRAAQSVAGGSVGTACRVPTAGDHQSMI